MGALGIEGPAANTETRANILSSISFESVQSVSVVSAKLECACGCYLDEGLGQRVGGALAGAVHVLLEVSGQILEHLWDVRHATSVLVRNAC